MADLEKVTQSKSLILNQHATITLVTTLNKAVNPPFMKGKYNYDFTNK